jgi:hypothetical protein
MGTEGEQGHDRFFILSYEATCQEIHEDGSVVVREMPVIRGERPLNRPVAWPGHITFRGAVHGTSR